MKAGHHDTPCHRLEFHAPRPWGDVDKAVHGLGMQLRRRASEIEVASDRTDLDPCPAGGDHLDRPGAAVAAVIPADLQRTPVEFGLRAADGDHVARTSP